MIHTQNKKIILINFILIIRIISTRRQNLVSMWFYIEITTFIFIFSILKKNNPIKSRVIYFIIRFISTILIFFSIVLINWNPIEISIFFDKNISEKFLITTAFIFKIGRIPFHFWVYKITENIDWSRLIILFTIQKIIPIWAILFLGSRKICRIIIIIRIFIAPIIPIKSKNVFFLLSTSRVINNIWILLASVFSIGSTIIFTIIYFLANINFINFLKKNNIKTTKIINSIQIILSLFSLIGFPPTPNFFAKLIIIKNIFLSQTNLVVLAITILISNIISSVIYLQFIISPIIFFKNIFSFKNFKTSRNYQNFILRLSPILFILSIIYN